MSAIFGLCGTAIWFMIFGYFMMNGYAWFALLTFIGGVSYWILE